MIDSHELKRRDSYLNKLIGFQDTEPVKVITGIRRCGKSSLLKLMVQHLKDTGIQPEQIIEMNFESFDFRGMSADDIYRYVKERSVPGKRMYLFFDLPDLALWPSAVGWWVHNDRIIVIAAADLTFYEFYTVINDPADRSISESG